MSDHVYKNIELTGPSKSGIDDAVSGAIAKASLTLRRLQRFEFIETRGQIAEGKIAYWQMTIKVGVTLQHNPNG